MRYTPIVAPPSTDLPPGYDLRPWREGDDDQWALLLDISASFGAWSMERHRLEAGRVVRRAQFFATHDAEIVAAAGLIDARLDGAPAWEVAWVVRHPGHAGHDLGRAVTVAAVRAGIEQLESRPTFLYTDDHRLTAIQLYLDLGFEPDVVADRSYPRRWDAVFDALRLRGARPRQQLQPEQPPQPGGDPPAPIVRQ